MHTNRLSEEKSPYLLQHAHNPVDWHAWNTEAFEKARKEEKPIFLSIGYSTCHWCHVMERESFESEEIAEVLNRYFVPVKVDREERPDVDRIYMTFVQATTGGGGWPMSVWLTPDLKPFFGGTYFPPESRWGRVGFKQVLEQLAAAWQNNRQQILESGQDILEQLRGFTTPEGGGRTDEAGCRDTGGVGLGGSVTIASHGGHDRSGTGCWTRGGSLVWAGFSRARSAPATGGMGTSWACSERAATRLRRAGARFDGERLLRC